METINYTCINSESKNGRLILTKFRLIEHKMSRTKNVILSTTNLFIRLLKWIMIMFPLRTKLVRTLIFCPDRSIIFGMWVDDYKVVCRIQ